MTIRIGLMALAPLAAGVLLLPLAACDKDNPFEKALTTLNGGTPVPGGPVSVAYVASPVVEVVEAVAPEPVECVVPAQLFRTMQCDEGGKLIPIR